MKYVAPLAGAWIEIYSVAFNILSQSVAPLAGAWIEIKAISESLMKGIYRKSVV